MARMDLAAAGDIDLAGALRVSSACSPNLANLLCNSVPHLPPKLILTARESEPNGATIVHNRRRDRLKRKQESIWEEDEEQRDREGSLRRRRHTLSDYTDVALLSQPMTARNMQSLALSRSAQHD
jgi:hypothetical protein